MADEINKMAPVPRCVYVALHRQIAADGDLKAMEQNDSLSCKGVWCRLVADAKTTVHTRQVTVQTPISHPSDPLLSSAYLKPLSAAHDSTFYQPGPVCRADVRIAETFVTITSQGENSILSWEETFQLKHFLRRETSPADSFRQWKTSLE
ncbi:hypothetical protein Bbelb_153560 [Branchiostoma belcheri]|nr:hypothetical protein Bbelb_153560 [Branchiostoma belcheri]